MNNLKYSPEQIQKAKELYKQGLSIYKIQKECGFKSTTPVRWHCNPVEKKKITERNADWCKQHPERAKEMIRKAVRKFQKKNAKVAQ